MFLPNVSYSSVGRPHAHAMWLSAARIQDELVRRKAEILSSPLKVSIGALAVNHPSASFRQRKDQDGGRIVFYVPGYQSEGV